MKDAIQPAATAAIEGRQILSLNQAAELLGCSRRFLELEAARGKLTVLRPSARLIRIRRTDLDRYLDASAITAA